MVRRIIKKTRGCYGRKINKRYCKVCGFLINPDFTRTVCCSNKCFAVYMKKKYSK